MEQKSVDSLMSITLDKIKTMVDANTVIGDPIITPDGKTTIIPVSKINYGFASGGSDLPSKKENPKALFAGGSGAGLTITPVAFISISDGNVRLLQIQPYNDATDRAISMLPEVVDKISSLFKKHKEKKEEKNNSGDNNKEINENKDTNNENL